MSEDASLIGWLKLARCRGLAPTDPARLVELAGGAEAFASSPVRAPRALGLTEDARRRLDGSSLQRQVEAELLEVRRLGARAICPDDHPYPEGLAALAVPPPVLTVLGDLSLIGSRGPAVAVVGSRRPSGYGIAMTADIVSPLSALGISIVSGLALGIDAKAHRVALEQCGPTVAVLGTGIDGVYPRQHERLAAAIAETGALVSEFPPGTPPLPRNFPRRNRIIVGLAYACVVVEGAERSGSLVTARWAQEEGRQVLAVPGRVGDEASAGPLALLRDGAAMAISAEDVLAELPPGMRPVRSTDPALAADLRRRDAEARLARCRESAPFSGEILRLLPTHDALHVDDLVDKSGKSPREVLETLFALELRDLIESAPGGFVRRSATGSKLASAGCGGGKNSPAPI